MRRPRPLDSGAVAFANARHAKQYGSGIIQKTDPQYEQKRRDWWTSYDAYIKKKKTPLPAKHTKKTPATITPAKKAKKPVQQCKPHEQTCSLVFCKAHCSHYPKERSYELNTKNIEDVIEVKAGSDQHNWDKITLHTEVRNISKCKDLSTFYQISGPDGTAVKSGPDAEIDVKWPGDLKRQWYKYFFPFALDPVTYQIRSTACPQEGRTDIDVHVYPDIEVKVTGKIDIRKSKETGQRERGIEIEYKVAKQKVVLSDIIDKINQIIGMFIKTKRAMDDISNLVSDVGGIKPKMIGPTVGFSLSAQIDEDQTTYEVKKKGAFNFVGDPVIGIEIEADIIKGVIRVMQLGASSTGIGVVVAALLQVIEFGRSKLGAGLYLIFTGAIKGEIGVEIMNWPQFQPKGKLGGDVVLTLTARAAKPGTFFILRFLSHARVGGQGGIEWYATKAGVDKKGGYIETECAFTGLALFYGKAKSTKTTRVSDSKGVYYLIEKRQFWKGERYYFWGNDK